MVRKGVAIQHRRVDCVVIGAGVVGAAIAQNLAREGVDVVVVDGADGVGGGCSYANAGIVAPSHVTPLATPALLREAPRQMLRRPPAVRVGADPTLVPWLSSLMVSAAPRRSGPSAAALRDLAVTSTRLHTELANRGLNPSLRKTGALDVHLKAPRRRPQNELSRDELQTMEPTLANVASGSHDSEEWTVESRSFVVAMLQDAAKHGAEIMFGSTVDQVLASGGSITGIRTGQLTISADRVVLAAGMGSRTLAHQVGLGLPLRGGRGHVLDVAGGADTPSMPVRIKDHRIVVTPLDDRVRVCGAIEFGRESRPVQHHRAEALRTVAGQAIPGLKNAEVIDRWAGERPCTPDGVPVIGPSSSVGNLLVAAGHGMWGLILAPVTAQLITEAIVTGGSQPDQSWLSPDRFGRHSRQLAPTG